MNTAMARTTANKEWITGLAAGQHDLTAALRKRIRAGLGAAFSGRPDVSDADLDDFTQEAMLQVLDRLSSFRGDSRFTTWAMAVAVRVSLTALRRRRWAAQPIGELLEELAAPQRPTQLSSAAGERSELMAALHSAIAAALTPRQRQVLLAELNGIPQVVLADRLGSNPGAIYKTSHDARRKLKAALQNAGYDAAAVQDVLSRG